ncbi:MAG: heparan-alpha-glucosaminide N-acetyltransferase domain-containing protein, partial [Bacteroidales bacterium]
MENSKENPVLRERLTSIDALRGFTMFWIIGGDRIMRALPKISDNAVFRVLDEQLRHKSWEGLNFYDIIFPLFLFIIGVSSYFSYKSRQGRGESKLNLYKHIFTRAAILFALGLIYYGAKDPQLKSLGYYGVLQLLAFGYLFSSLIMINTSVRGIAIWAGGIII